MEILVTREQIKNVLNEAKTQFISISVSNHSGKWSDQYFLLQEIKEFKQGDQKITMLILISPEDSGCVAIDTKLISGIKFNKYLNLNGQLSNGIRIVSKDPVLQPSY